MNDKPEQTEGLTDQLAEGIAAVMAASEELGQPEELEQHRDMADLFLDELNRLWLAPADFGAGEEAAAA
jgi:hypothetical protein